MSRALTGLWNKVLYTVAAVAIAQVLACLLFSYMFLPWGVCGSDECSGLSGPVRQECIYEQNRGERGEY